MLSALLLVSDYTCRHDHNSFGEVWKSSVVLASLAYADCQSENGWTVTPSGSEATKPCEGDTVGYQVRKCTNDIWENVDTQYCLPKYPVEGKGFVDFYLFISNSQTKKIQEDKAQKVVNGLVNYYTNLAEDDISTHRIVAVNNVFVVDFAI